MQKIYRLESKQAVQALESDAKAGLTEQEAAKRLAKYGENYISLDEEVSFLKLLVAQFKNPLVLLLLVTVIIAAAIGEKLEAILITGIVVFMSCIGAYLEYGAGNALKKIKGYLASSIRTLRGGKINEIDVRLLVPGDIIFVTEGDKVPADARLLHVNELKVDEAVLTKEGFTDIAIFDGGLKTWLDAQLPLVKG